MVNMSLTAFKNTKLGSYRFLQCDNKFEAIVLKKESTANLPRFQSTERYFSANEIKE